MEQILENFCKKWDSPCGLMLLPLTTGSGKTHRVLQYIADLLTREREQKFFFITTQKKNLFGRICNPTVTSISIFRAGRNS